MHKVISNTTPILSLLKINKLYLLKGLYGKISVPEFFENPRGNTLELAVAIFKCRADSSQHDPLVLCSGGPGSSNIDDFVPALAGGLGNLFLQTRDVIIIETRGLKYSGSFLQIP